MCSFVGSVRALYRDLLPLWDSQWLYVFGGFGLALVFTGGNFLAALGLYVVVDWLLFSGLLPFLYTNFPSFRLALDRFRANCWSALRGLTGLTLLSEQEGRSSQRENVGSASRPTMLRSPCDSTDTGDAQSTPQQTASDLFRAYGPGYACVTGATSGLGLAFAKQLRDAGFDLVLLGRDQKRLETAKQAVRAAGTSSATSSGTTTSSSEPDVQLLTTTDKSAAQVFDALKEFDLAVLVNCAGAIETGHFAQQDTEKLRALLDVNVTALAEFSHLFVKRAKDRASAGGAVAAAGKAKRRSLLLNVGSRAGYVASPGAATYSASKAFVHMLSENLAHECQNFMDVVCLRPSLVSTPMTGDKQLSLFVVSADRSVAETLAKVELMSTQGAVFTNGPWEHELDGAYWSLFQKFFPERLKERRFAVYDKAWPASSNTAAAAPAADVTTTTTTSPPTLALVTDQSYKAKGRDYGAEDDHLKSLLTKRGLDVTLVQARDSELDTKTLAPLDRFDAVLVRNSGPRDGHEALFQAFVRESSTSEEGGAQERPRVNFVNDFSLRGDLQGKRHLVQLWDQASDRPCDALREHDGGVLPCYTVRQLADRLLEEDSSETVRLFRDGVVLKPLDSADSNGLVLVKFDDDDKTAEQLRKMLATRFGGGSHPSGDSAQQQQDAAQLDPEQYVVQPLVDLKSELSLFFVGSKFVYALNSVPDGRWELEETKPTEQELSLATALMRWNNYDCPRRLGRCSADQAGGDSRPWRGVVRVDLGRLRKGGGSVLVELEDYNPYLSLHLLRAETRERFVDLLAEECKRAVLLASK